MKRKFLLASLVLTIAVTLMGFTHDRGKAAAYECKIMVGIGYKQTKCGGDNGLTVSEAVDFFGTANSYDTYDQMRNTITNTILQYNRIEQKDINFSSSSKKYAVVIS